MKYYMIAGERSGDLHGSNLIKALKNIDNSTQIRCFGGEAMENAGGELVVHYRDLAFMGVVEVLANIRKIANYFKYCKKDILAYQPDALILIDYAGFNLRVAKFAKRNNLKVIYYISPKVWAWRQSRATVIKSLVDKMLVILPFEKDFYRKFKFEVDYVGNPVADAVKSHSVNQKFITQNKLPEDKPLIALLPGSRKQELLRILPIMASTAKNFPEYHFVVAAIKNLPQKFYSILKLKNISLVEEQTYDLFAHSHAAIVTSGTATLEAALWNVPQVVVYKADPLSFSIGSRLIKANISYFSLVNLIAGYEVVKELLQKKVNVENLTYELKKLLTPEGRSEVLKGYQKLKINLGDRLASETAARNIYSFLLK